MSESTEQQLAPFEDGWSDLLHGGSWSGIEGDRVELFHGNVATVLTRREWMQIAADMGWNGTRAGEMR